MKKLSLFLIGLLLVPALFTSCDRGDDPEGGEVATPAFTTMKTYMLANDLDVDKIKTNTSGEKFVVPAPDLAGLQAFLDTYYIMDIRQPADFAAARIEGANNVAFGDILTVAATTTKPILVVCYSGQTACYATSLLRLYGFDRTRALKWGMSGWNSSTAGSWNNNIGTEANGHPNWSQEDTPPSVQVFSDPSFTSSLSDGEAILKQRVEAVVAAGFGPATVKGTDVLNSPGNYFINNYFSEAAYSSFGHIDGAYRIDPFVLADNTYRGLDPASGAKVVNYCYTGQTSAVLTAWLRVLGYDAYTMTFGMNGIYNDNPAWSSNQWGGDSGPKELPIIPD